MPLGKYAEKRSFDRTPEPPPNATGALQERTAEAPMFCVQRHSARRLHYDLRLEMDGVLKSWAVPKGPTLDPAEKRLAVLVENHPIEYGSFEGAIPAGNYGAGSVLLWDKGTFEWLTDKTPQQMFAGGDLKFRMHGEKLMGEFALVRMKRGKGDEWLLIKKKDFAVRAGWSPEDDLRSVAPKNADASLVPGAKRAPMPSQISPMKATLTGTLPHGSEWVYEIKWDGFRAICYVANGKVRLRSRNDNPLDALFPELRALPEYLQAKDAVLDGEIVCLDEQGRSSFELIQGRTGMKGSEAVREGHKAPVALFAFDLLYLNGYDLRQATLEERKRLLHSIIKPGPLVRYSEHFSGSGDQLLEAARQNGLEGLIAKQAASRYESRRSPNWLKIKIVNQQEFVICGWNEGERAGFGSLVLGYYSGEEMKWAGNVGTGFSHQAVAEMLKGLKKLAVSKAPFREVAADIRQAHWVRPELVCEVKFQEWTRDGRLRAPVFLGMRTDVAPSEVVRELPGKESKPAAKKAAGRKAAVLSAVHAAEHKIAVPKKTAGARGVLPSHSPLLPEAQTEVAMDIDGHRLKFTNLNKVFYPKGGYTKRDVINYYDRVAERILPHLAGRPLSLKRYPNGITGKFFFQKNSPASFPSWLHIEPIHSEERGEDIRYVVADDRASLLFLTNLGCIDQNPWMSRAGTLEHPDFILIDLDPVDCPYDRIVEAAQMVHRKLDAIGLKGFPKTTGGDGMHIYVPVDTVYSYEQTRTFAEILARLCAQEREDLFTTPRTVEKRTKGKVYFDHMQNREGSTISAPYVLRAYPGAPVATPLQWDEVVKGLTPDQFHIGNAAARFEQVGDLFGPVLKVRQRLDKALEKLGKMLGQGLKESSGSNSSRSSKAPRRRQKS
ncbi:MAG TPA: DNA ligase D [Terriglobales bacterium]|nr:DNA ligase D [Terriglobales bacterium]